MSKELSITADVKAAQDALKTTAYNMPKIQRRVLSVTGQGFVKVIKRHISADTKKQTGGLRNSYRYKIKKDGSKLSIFPVKGTTAKGGKVFPVKAYVMNYGAEIKAKHGFLFIHGKGYFARPARVTIRGRNFLQKSESQYIESGLYRKDVEVAMQKMLDKYWGGK